jgi:hypothetical protein
MTTSSNYADKISKPTFETQDETNQFTDGFETQAITERFEIERRLREDASRATRLEAMDPYEGMYSVTTRANSRRYSQRNILPERRDEKIRTRETISNFVISDFNITQNDSGEYIAIFKINNKEYYGTDSANMVKAVINAFQIKSKQELVMFSPFVIPTFLGSALPEVVEIKQDRDITEVVATYTTTNQSGVEIKCEFTSISNNSDPRIAFCEAVAQAFAEVKKQVIEARETY